MNYVLQVNFAVFTEQVSSEAKDSPAWWILVASEQI